VFDWLWCGGRDAGFAGHPLADWTSEWKLNGAMAGEWPGVYRRSDGAVRAFNPPAMPMAGEATGDWQKEIKGLSSDRPWVDLTSWMVIACLVCLAGAALLWRG
jgi:hypothetical protein